MEKALPQKKKTNFIWKHRALLAAFLAPVIILLIIYIIREIYPFGDQMYLRSDMYHQYAPFLKLFQNTLKTGGSLLYTWDIGLGSNFVSTYAYYLATPVNWLTLLLPSDHIPEIMSVFLILKSGLMSAALTYYLEKRFRKKSLLCAAFGVFYALSGYMAAYSWNVMWIDCLILLPLMMLGLERLVKQRRFLLYTVCFGISVLSNYYIAIMLCIFSALYFIYLMAAETKHRDAMDVLAKIARYLLFSLIGGLIGAVLFIPALLTLFHTASSGSAFPDTLRAYFNLLELFAHGTMNAEITMMEGYVPNIYCGIAAFALVPLFVLNRGIPVRVRAGKCALLAVMLFSFTFNVPAFIWHGFHFPNSLPARQSFLYIFLILIIGFEVLIRIRNHKMREIVICFAAAVFAVFALQVLYDNEAHPLSAAYISAGFLLIYGILFLLYRRAQSRPAGKEKQEEDALLLPKKRSRRKVLNAVCIGLIFLAFCFEAAINLEATGYGTTSRSNYMDDGETIETLLSDIPNTDFYRVEKYRRRTKNDGAWNGCRSASVFSSAATEALSDFYDSFGMQHGTNSFSHYGSTPFSSALLSVRYKLSDQKEDDPFAYLIREENDVYLYQSKYCLPPVFLTRSTIKAEVNPDNSDPFAVQNDFVDAACGGAPVFQTDGKCSGETVSYTAKKDGDLFFYVDREFETLTITFQNRSGDENVKNISSVECDMIVYAGKVAAGETLTLTDSGEDKTSFTAVPAYLDEAALEQAVQTLSAGGLTEVSFTDTSLEGVVTADKESMLFTSIPYDPGWQVTVDGKTVETDDFYGAFLMVPVSGGTHEIRFTYHVPGLLVGAVISVCAVAALVLLCLFAKKKR